MLTRSRSASSGCGVRMALAWSSSRRVLSERTVRSEGGGEDAGVCGRGVSSTEVGSTGSTACALRGGVVLAGDDVSGVGVGLRHTGTQQG